MTKWLLAVLSVSIILYSGCATYSQGKRIYDSQCANCHGFNGEGLAALYPALNKSDIVSHHTDRIPCIIENGKSTKDSLGNVTSEMPPVKDLTPADVTNLINYLLSINPNGPETVTIDSVKAWNSICN